MNEFTTIFEKTAGGMLATALLHFAIGAGLLIWGIVGFIRHRRIQGRRATLLLLLAMLGLGWWADNTPLFLFIAYDLRGEPQITEGVVHVSSMQPYWRPLGKGHHPGDKITVGDQPFEVDYFHESLGYKRTIAHGGALGEGIYARLHHYNGRIVKVEVRTKRTGQQGP